MIFSVCLFNSLLIILNLLQTNCLFYLFMTVIIEKLNKKKNQLTCKGNDKANIFPRCMQDENYFKSFMVREIILVSLPV